MWGTACKSSFKVKIILTVIHDDSEAAKFGGQLFKGSLGLVRLLAQSTKLLLSSLVSLSTLRAPVRVARIPLL